MLILKVLVFVLLSMNGICSRQAKEEQIAAELKEKYKWDWKRLISWDMFRFGDYISKANEPEYRFPFGINNGKISRNRSLDCTCGLSSLLTLNASESNNTNTNISTIATSTINESNDTIVNANLNSNISNASNDTIVNANLNSNINNASNDTNGNANVNSNSNKKSSINANNNNMINANVSSNNNESINISESSNTTENINNVNTSTNSRRRRSTDQKIIINPNNNTENRTDLQFPWLVFIYVDGFSNPESTNNNPVCSGTIITDKVILTAASCLVDTSIMQEEDQMRTLFNPETFQPNPEDVFVLKPNGSTIDLSNEATFTRLEVAEVFYNRQFFYSKLFYEKLDWDIAFLVLSQPLIFNDSSGFTPICLPSKYYTDSFLEGVALFSLGWLKVVSRHVGSGEVKTTYELKRYSVTYAHPKVRCQTLAAQNWISERFFCSNGPPFLQSKFIEAHGGPMLAQLSTPPYSFVQYGIVSWDLMGMLHHKKNVRVSTNVSGFLQLIHEFSDAVDAQWCANEGEEDEPFPDPNWDKGVDLNKPFILQRVPNSEWEEATSDHRQYHSLSICRCGKVSNTTHNKMSTSPNTWNVQLTASFSDGEQKHCTGTVINDRILLTAGACVHKIQQPHKDEGKRFGKILELVSPEMLQVRLSTKSDIKFVRNDSVLVEVMMVVPHVEFRGELCKASEYDTALIVLKSPLNLYNLKGQVSSVCLPETTEQLHLDEGRNDAVVYRRQQLSNIPQKVNVNLLGKEQCKTLWKYTGKKVHKVFHKVSECIKEKFEFNSRFCGAYNLEVQAGPGNPDHGSPILIPKDVTDKSATMVQVGFVSQISYDLMKEVVTNLENDTDSKPKSVVVYNKIQPLLPFIDYISLVMDAKWCLRG